MSYIPAPHLLRDLTYRLSEDDEANVLNQTAENVEHLEPPVDVELNAEEISIHRDLLLHHVGGKHVGAAPLSSHLRY